MRPSDSPQAIVAKTRCHEVYRATCKAGDLTWRAGWPDSAEAYFQFVEQIIYQTDFDTPLLSALRNRKTFAETMDIPEIANEISQIGELWDKEQMKATERASGLENPDTAPAAGMETGQACEVEGDVDTHMQVTGSEKLDDESSERLKRFKAFAKKLIATHVTLVVEPNSEAL
eukprot:5975739-Pyramimonas_sp.AAC.1